MFPFIRTGMTDQYADNERVFGRWQSRMLEPSEMAKAFMALLDQPAEQTDGGMFELMVEDGDQDKVEVAWQQVKFNLAEEKLDWSYHDPLRF